MTRIGDLLFSNDRLIGVVTSVISATEVRYRIVNRWRVMIYHIIEGWAIALHKIAVKIAKGVAKS